VTTVTIFNNPLELEAGEVFDNVEDIHALFQSKWPVFPKTARIYHRSVAQSCDVTPKNEHEIEALGKLNGNVYVVLYPEGFEVIAIIVAVVLAAVAIGISFLIRPNTKLNQNNQQPSPNNSLSDRQNTNRPNERIPDIVGTVRSTPDLIAVPYKYFINNQEVEHFYGCIGKGSYQIEQTHSTSVDDPTVVWDVKDDTTPLQEIDGSSFAIYGPNTSPNSGNAPQLAVGDPINTQIVNIQPSNCVNGQVLRAPNASNLTGKDNIRVTAAGTVETNDGTIDFNAYYAVGDTVSLVYGDAADPGHVHPNVSVVGDYTLLAVTTNSLTLANPSSVSAGWAALASFTGAASTYGSPVLVDLNDRHVGPFILNVGSMTEVWCNFVAPNGLFKISNESGNQYPIDVDVQIELQALNASYQPVGDIIAFTGTLVGSAVLQSQRGVTVKCKLPTRANGSVAGVCQISAIRLTASDKDFDGTVNDQVQWRDLYAVSPIAVSNFGNVTTIQTLTYATASALSVKARKLNLQVTRLLPSYASGSASAPIATKNAADILMYLATEPYIGNRTLAEIDVAELYSVLGPSGSVQSYFGTSLCTEFCYTFDDAQVSFEESVADVTQATFCTAFRRGSVMSVSFERQTANSVLLFNHRNKIPGSETRTITFGKTNDYDGIELDYIDPFAPNYPDLDTTVTLHFPPDQSAVNPKKITSVGIRNRVQAWMLGWRLYNKLIYQNTAVDFKSTQEAALLVLQDRILVADNTRADTQDGQITGQSGLTLFLSQNFDVIGGHNYIIFLQRYDGAVDSIVVTAQAGTITTTDEGKSRSMALNLQRAPIVPLVLDPDKYAATTYWIVDQTTSSNVAKAFLLSEKDPEDGMQYTVKAVNYDDRYYSRDQDFINGSVNLGDYESIPNSGFTGVIGDPGSGDPHNAQFNLVTSRYPPESLPNGTLGREYFNVNSVTIINGGSGWVNPVATISGYAMSAVDASDTFPVSVNCTVTKSGDTITFIDPGLAQSTYWLQVPTLVVQES
jgi:hypothetical protein